MSSETLQRERLHTGPAPFSDDFVAGEATPRLGRVNVIHGVYAHSLPLVGKTVREAREELEDRMNISAEAVAIVDGIEVGEEEILHENQVLNFLTPSGEKG